MNWQNLMTSSLHVAPYVIAAIAFLVILRRDPWRIVIWFIPAWTITGVLTFFGWWGPGIGLGFLWIAFCIYKGTYILKEKEFATVERLGKYRRVMFRGWNVLIIGVDRIRLSGDLRAKEYELYADERETEIDFTDGVSAVVIAKVWYQIGKPDDMLRNRWQEIAAAVYKWTYGYEDAEARIFALADASLRPKLQSVSSDEAAKNLDTIADVVCTEVGPMFEEIGAYTPDGKKLLVIEDIDLPEDVIAIRRKVIEGEKEATEREREAEGYWKPIKQIADNLGVSTEIARGIYENQQGLRVLRETKPSMTLVGKDVKGVIGTLNLNGNPAGGEHA